MHPATSNRYAVIDNSLFLTMALSLTYMPASIADTRAINCEEAEQLLKQGLSDDNQGRVSTILKQGACHITFRGDVELSKFVDISHLNKPAVIMQEDLPPPRREAPRYILIRPHYPAVSESSPLLSPLIPVPLHSHSLDISAPENSTKVGLSATPGFSDHHLLALPSDSIVKHAFPVSRRHLKPLPTGCYSPGVVFQAAGDIRQVSGLWFSDPETPGCRPEHFGMSLSQEPNDAIEHSGRKKTSDSSGATKQTGETDKSDSEEEENDDEVPKSKPLTASGDDRRSPDKNLPPRKDSEPEKAAGLNSDEFWRLNSLMWRLQQAKTKPGNKAKKAEGGAEGFDRVGNLIHEIKKLLNKASRFDFTYIIRHWDSYNLVKQHL